MNAARFWIAGRVQGVAYRAHTRQHALALGLTGYARNLPDGRVEVFAMGAPAALDALARWLGQGPPAARVVSVQRENAEIVHTAGFQIG